MRQKPEPEHCQLYNHSPCYTGGYKVGHVQTCIALAPVERLATQSPAKSIVVIFWDFWSEVNNEYIRFFISN